MNNEPMQEAAATIHVPHVCRTWNDALDAAEAAVADDDIPPRWWKSMFFGGRRARHWCQYGWDWKKRDALAAIRGLKEKP